MQTFQCQHCRVTFDSVFHCFLHIFCRHMHQDIALIPSESHTLLANSAKYNMKEELCLN